ncbi:hypothetical protein AX17_005649 [Amanita inopinata Kibby_2008]|nr:hypothetical protein AX17_005649 [Amanita inopinata Kibby_2008]
MSQPFSPLSRTDTYFTHRGFSVPDPFAPRQRPGASFLNAVLATALFRCWHILVLFSAWSTLITILNSQGYRLNFQSTLLTVLGTVLGFVISYRTTSSFERYNEGRRFWSQIIFASRSFARTVWFHVIDPNMNVGGDAGENAKMRALVEKKTVINLLEGFAVAVKHYLRGEDGIYYQDLYYLVKFLPGYALPAGRPSFGAYPSDDADLPSPTSAATPSMADQKSAQTSDVQVPKNESQCYQRSISGSSTLAGTLLPVPVTSPRRVVRHQSVKSPGGRISMRSGVPGSFWDKDKVILSRADESLLLPAHMPPKYHFFDLFPFSLLVKWLAEEGKAVKGKKAARLRAQMLGKGVSHNVPLEISLYLSSYIAALQDRKICDVPTTNLLMMSLNQLVDSLTGLERILTTPIPFSYSVHLWVVTILYCLALPFQIWTSLGWVTIPGTIAVSFIFFGFLVAGEEIENPFGYDKNDLNLDHFTHNIIRNELRAVTSAPPPDPARWAFSLENDLIFSSNIERDERISPEDWMKRGYASMISALSVV